MIPGARWQSPLPVRTKRSSRNVAPDGKVIYRTLGSVDLLEMRRKILAAMPSEYVDFNKYRSVSNRSSKPEYRSRRKGIGMRPKGSAITQQFSKAAHKSVIETILCSIKELKPTYGARKFLMNKNPFETTLCLRRLLRRGGNVASRQPSRSNYWHDGENCLKGETGKCLIVID